jgi:hypothetical protein
MNIEGIVDQVNQTAQPIDIEFVPGQDKKFGVDDLEEYPVAKMRARITGGRNEADDTSVLFVDFAPFDAHNRPFETADFWHTDKAGNSILADARTAGKYKAQTKLYLPASLPSEQIFRVLPAPAQELIAAWQAQDDGTSYVAFLEARVADLQAHIRTQVVPGQIKPDTEQAGPSETRPRASGPRP